MGHLAGELYIREFNMSLRIRAAVPDDGQVIVDLICELATFEKATAGEVRVTVDDIRRYGFGDKPMFDCLIAELDGRAVGMALFFHNFSTWEGQPGLYLEDLYVRQEARGKQVGYALMVELARLAVARGCRRLDWSVLDWNPAIGFYQRIGARQMHTWLPFRLSGAALEQLAAREVGGSETALQQSG
jgi:GNAT superfamily N-acetyltransferase